MNLRASEVLLTDIQADPRHQAFGSRIAHIGIRATNLDSPTVLREMSDGVTWLQRGIKDLLQSTGYKDMRAVEHVSTRFDSDDRNTFEWETEDYRETEVGPNILTWLASASVKDFALFAIWNTARRHQLQSRLDEEFSDRRDKALEDVDRFVDAGIYPAEAVKLYSERFDRYGNFTAIDSFEAGLMCADGYCGDDIIGISNLYTRPEDMRGDNRNFRSTVIHEATHGVARNGGWHDRGFSLGVATPYTYIHTLEEYWASKTEASVYFIEHEQNGWPRSDLAAHMQLPSTNRSYPHLNTYYDLVTGLSDKLSMPLIGHAYMSHRDSSEGLRLRQEVEDAITTITGEREFFDINDRYDAVETTEERVDLMNSESQKLDPFTSYEPAIGDVRSISFKE